MDIQWRYWWDTCQTINFRCGNSHENTLHVAGWNGEKAYGVTVRADTRYERQFLKAAKNHITDKLQETSDEIRGNPDHCP